MCTYIMQGNIQTFLRYMYFVINFPLTAIMLFRQIKSITTPNR
jgi:hypothetical protein